MTLRYAITCDVARVTTPAQTAGLVGVRCQGCGTRWHTIYGLLAHAHHHIDHHAREDTA